MGGSVAWSVGATRRQRVRRGGLKRAKDAARQKQLRSRQPADETYTERTRSVRVDNERAATEPDVISDTQWLRHNLRRDKRLRAGVDRHRLGTTRGTTSRVGHRSYTCSYDRSNRSVAARARDRRLQSDASAG